MRYFLILIMSILILGNHLDVQAQTCTYDFDNNFDDQVNFCDLIDCNNCTDVTLNNLNDKNGNSLVTFNQDIVLTNLTLNYKDGNSPLELVIPSGVTVEITNNLDFNLNSDPQDKFLTVEGTLIVGGNLDFDGIDMEIDGNGSIDAGSITGADGVTCDASDGGTTTCPDITADTCEDGGTNNFCSESVTPVELLFFNAAAENGTVNLKWATASEENFDYFSVERSINAKEYEVLGTVQGKGWSDDVVNYSFTDHHPLKGRAYYRLKATDLDRTYEYFQPVMVNAGDANGRSIKITTNPVKNAPVKFQLNFAAEGDIEVTVVDLSGVEVYKGLHKSGRSMYSIDAKLDKGIYLMKVSTENGVYTSRFIKN